MIVLGIMGKANSGKDFVADWFADNKNFMKVSFADVMKRLAGRVFEYTELQLWGPSDERNKEEATSATLWDDWERNFNVEVLPFVRSMGFDSVIREGLLVKALQGWFLKLRLDYHNQPISPRIVLQLLGTEMGRNFDQNLWVNYIYDVVIPKLANGGHNYSRVVGVVLVTSGEAPAPAGIVIADHRFKNEVATTQSNGGFVIRVRRLSKEDAQQEGVGLKGHASETEMEEIPDSALNLTLKLNDGKDNVYPVLEQVFQKQLWAQGLGTLVGPEVP